MTVQQQQKYNGITTTRPFNVPTKNVGSHSETVTLTMVVSGDDEPVLVRALNFIGGQLVTLDTQTATENQVILLSNTAQVVAAVRATNATILGEAIARLQPGESIGIRFDGTNFVLST